MIFIFIMNWKITSIIVLKGLIMKIGQKYNDKQFNLGQRTGRVLALRPVLINTAAADDKMIPHPIWRKPDINFI